jgi:7-keto-8-aminopelargonate synthetase-like enzyme
MRWGVGAGSSRTVAGTMTIHRRLEERLADFVGREATMVFGAGLEASAGVIGALAGPGDVVFSDEFNQPAIADGCLMSGAQTFVYEHLDLEHLAWGIENTTGRAALIVSESVFGANGDLAPLDDLSYLAERHRVRLMIDEAHGLGTLGPDGRGAVAEAGLENQIDVLVGSLDNALGSAGAFVACDGETACYLRSAARSFMFCTAPPPPTLAGALAALELLAARPELVRRLRANATVLRRELGREGVAAGAYETHILAVELGDPDLAARSAAAALDGGVFVHASTPPAVSPEAAGLRLSVMASHRPEELRAAARSLGQIVARVATRADSRGAWRSEHFDTEPWAAERLEMEPFAEQLASPTPGGVFDLEADDHPRPSGIFDLEADEPLAA